MRDIFIFILDAPAHCEALSFTSSCRQGVQVPAFVSLAIFKLIIHRFIYFFSSWLSSNYPDSKLMTKWPIWDDCVCLKCIISPLCRLACHQFPWTPFIIAFETFWQNLPAPYFKLPVFLHKTTHLAPLTDANYTREMCAYVHACIIFGSSRRASISPFNLSTKTKTKKKQGYLVQKSNSQTVNLQQVFIDFQIFSLSFLLPAISSFHKGYHHTVAMLSCHFRGCSEKRSRGRIPHSPVISEEHMAKWINRRHPLSVIAFVPALRIHWCCGFDTPEDNGRPQLTDIVLSVAAGRVHTERASEPLTSLVSQQPRCARGPLGVL